MLVWNPFSSPFLYRSSIWLCSNLGMFKLMLIPELVRKIHSFHSADEWKKAGWKMIQPKKIWGRNQFECDPQQTGGVLLSAYRDTNHRFTSIRLLLITSSLTGVYLDLWSVISGEKTWKVFHASQAYSGNLISTVVVFFKLKLLSFSIAVYSETRREIERKAKKKHCHIKAQTSIYRDL